MTRKTRLGLLVSAAMIVLIAVVVVAVVKTRQSVDHYRQGLASWEQGDLHAAIASLNKAIQQNPDDAKVFTTRGDVYYDKGELDQAIDGLHKCPSGRCEQWRCPARSWPCVLRKE